jgi:putative aminopeptidase FrvX
MKVVRHKTGKGHLEERMNEISVTKETTCKKFISVSGITKTSNRQQATGNKRIKTFELDNKYSILNS